MEEEKRSEGQEILPAFDKERESTLFALEDIRQSFTLPTRLQQEQNERMEMAEEQVRKLKEKPKRRTRAMKLRERIRENSRTVIPENQRPVPHYIARILTDKPLITKDFDEMRKEGADSYYLQQSQKFISGQGKNIGIPRPIYTKLLDSVVQEEDTRREKHAAAVESKKKKLMSKDTLDLKKSGKRKKSSKVKRPHTAGSKRSGDDRSMPALTQPDEAEEATLESRLGRDRLDLLRSTSIAKAEGLPATRAAAPDFGSPTMHRTSSDLEGETAKLTNKEANHMVKKSSDVIKKPRFMSTWGRPGQKSPQRLKREQLLKEREEAILKRVQDMEKRHRKEAILKELQGRQYPWLFIVSHLSRMQMWREKYLNEIKPERDAERRAKEANKKKYAIVTISNWWFFKRISLRMKLNPWASNIIRGYVRLAWATIQRRKRRAGAAQVVRFLRDCVGSDKVKRMYTYRTKIIKIQRWFRMWYNLQEQRMQTLWRAMEIIGKRRVEIAQRDARIAERKALKAMSEAGGFSNILNHIDQTAMKIDGYLVTKEKEAKQRAEMEAIRSAVKAEAQKKEAQKKERGKRAMGAGGKPKAGGRRALQRQASNSHLGGLGASGARWMRRTYVNPATREKFAALRNLLQKERTRHILAVTESEKRHTTRTAGGRLPKVNLDALKEFLAAAPADVDENFDLFEEDEDEPKPKDKNNPTKRHTKHRKYQAHPIFLFFSQGGLDFFHAVPLDFFRGVVPGFDNGLEM